MPLPNPCKMLHRLCKVTRTRQKTSCRSSRIYKRLSGESMSDTDTSFHSRWSWGLGLGSGDGYDATLDDLVPPMAPWAGSLERKDDGLSACSPGSSLSGFVPMPSSPRSIPHTSQDQEAGQPPLIMSLVYPHLRWPVPPDVGALPTWSSPSEDLNSSASDDNVGKYRISMPSLGEDFGSIVAASYELSTFLHADSTGPAGDSDLIRGSRLRDSSSLAADSYLQRWGSSSTTSSASAASSMAMGLWLAPLTHLLYPLSCGGHTSANDLEPTPPDELERGRLGSTLTILRQHRKVRSVGAEGFPQGPFACPRVEGEQIALLDLSHPQSHHGPTGPPLRVSYPPSA